MGRVMRIVLVLAATLLLATQALAQQAYGPGARVECNNGSGHWQAGTIVPFLRGDMYNGRPATSGYFYRVRLDPQDPDQPSKFCRAMDLRPIAAALAPRPIPETRPTVRPTPAPAPSPTPLPLPIPSPTPEPPPVPAPAPVVPTPGLPRALVGDMSECGPRPDPVSNRIGCAQQVSMISPHWAGCAGGDEVACHRFVRDVVWALSQGDPRWGLISKPPGQQSCDETKCGPTGGFGEDVAAYLPDGSSSNQWIGADIVGGAGAPGARVQWMSLDPSTNRRDNLHAKLPR